MYEPKGFWAVRRIKKKKEEKKTDQTTPGLRISGRVIPDCIQMKMELNPRRRVIAFGGHPDDVRRFGAHACRFPAHLPT